MASKKKKVVAKVKEKTWDETNAPEKKNTTELTEKSWNEIKATDSWQIFRMMSEFVHGFDTMARVGPCVSVFGSARTKPNHKYYKLATEIAFQLTKHGYGIITGGG